MAFSTLRGRPRSRPPAVDPGTPELRLKHAIGLTSEPIDLCLEATLITADQHWCGLHLRWLYTLRYGAPVLSTRYASVSAHEPAAEKTEEWRCRREREYLESIALLKTARRYEPVMRLCVFNELPAFLDHQLKTRATADAALARQLLRTQHILCTGLDLLIELWRRPNLL